MVEKTQMVEKIPADEEQQIANIVELTIKQLEMRYPSPNRVLRGVHPKDHGCVRGEFRVLDDLAPELHEGVFASPGRVYATWIRFSNADPLVRRDSEPEAEAIPVQHDSRGMAIKLMGVDGEVLRRTDDLPAQDFLLVNQPVFAFANVEDYEVLSRVLVDNRDDASSFFVERMPRPGTPPTPSQMRAVKTLEIVRRVKSPNMSSTPPAFQTPPASPVDNDYFGAAPFMFGSHRVMRFRVCTDSRSTDEPNIADPNYLRTALVKRLREFSLGDVVFHFEVQVRDVASIDPDIDIENASFDWPDSFPFTRVAKLTIPCQEFDCEERNKQCEEMVFTPWHTVPAHRPIGGINRLRLAVYEASVQARKSAKSVKQ
jgi:hypothetical protein